MKSAMLPPGHRNGEGERTWVEVVSRGKLSHVDDNILTVVGEIEMPLMNLPRRMTVVRLHDSRLVVFSAIALAEHAMAALEAFARPACFDRTE
jgi:hypothetical protein